MLRNGALIAVPSDPWFYLAAWPALFVISFIKGGFAILGGLVEKLRGKLYDIM